MEADAAAAKYAADARAMLASVGPLPADDGAAEALGRAYAAMMLAASGGLFPQSWGPPAAVFLALANGYARAARVPDHGASTPLTVLRQFLGGRVPIEASTLPKPLPRAEFEAGELYLYEERYGQRRLLVPQRAWHAVVTDGSVLGALRDAGILIAEPGRLTKKVPKSFCSEPARAYWFEASVLQDPSGRLAAARDS